VRCISALQLVCFYYVFTTFTTVGYGTSTAPRNQRFNVNDEWFFASGDISASSDGERVSANNGRFLSEYSAFHGTDDPLKKRLLHLGFS
jgi:hypothetical protein